MLKKCLFIMLLIIFYYNCFLNNNYICFAESTYYARISSTTANLYKAPELESDNSNILFSLPMSYFVKVLDKDINDYYLVEYIDKKGYVKASDIKFIDGTPIQPYANNLSFRVFATGGISLRSTPYSAGGGMNLVTTIPFLDTNLIYYGSCEGEESIIYKGNIWYYCKYYTSEKSYEGYVYSAFCDMLTEITPNTEIFEYITAPSFEEDINPSVPVDNLSKLSSTSQVLIVAGASLPCIAIVYFLFKPTKIALDSRASAKTKKPKKKIKKLRHSDYYELDDSFFT